MRINLKGHHTRLIGGGKRTVIPLLAFICFVVGMGWTAWESSFVEPTSSVIFLPPKSELRRNLRIAFAGNSIIFIHDGPGLLVAMLESSSEYDSVEYDACLSPGASLVTLWRDYADDPMIAGGCFPNFSTTNHGTMTMERLLVGDKDAQSQQKQQRQHQQWDFVVMNDQTRAPAFAGSRYSALKILKSKYAPKLYQAGATPIFLQTAAYRSEKARTAVGLGSFESFTQKLTEGYQTYAKTLIDHFALENSVQQQTTLQNRSYPSEAIVAPVGNSYAYLLHNPGKFDLFDKLYLDDDVHPSPYGTWLQSCVLYSIISGKAPPPYSTKFWKTKSGHRRTQYPIPSPDEGRVLRDVAWQNVRLMWKASNVVSS